MNGKDTVKARAALDFLGWLSQYSPEVYAAVLEQVPEAAAQMSVTPHMQGLGQDPTTATTTQPAAVPWWEKIVDVAGSIGSAYLNYQAQKDILKVQQDRASRGLPPITSDVYAPTIRHQVDVPQEFKQAAMGTGTLLALGGGALLLFMMMNR